MNPTSLAPVFLLFKLICLEQNLIWHKHKVIIYKVIDVRTLAITSKNLHTLRHQFSDSAGEFDKEGCISREMALNTSQANITDICDPDKHHDIRHDVLHGFHLVGHFGAGGSLLVIELITNEIFPTVARWSSLTTSRVMIRGEKMRSRPKQLKTILRSLCKKKCEKYAE